MRHQTSQFDYLFLLNIPVPIYLLNGEITSLKTPSLKEYYSDINYRRIEDLFMISLLELQLNPQDFGFIAEGYLELIMAAKHEDESNSIFELFEEISGLEVSTGEITCNGVPLREEDILEIRYAYLLATGKVDINGEPRGGGASEDEDEMSRKIRESEERIKALKNEHGQKDTISFKQMLSLIIYELNKSPQEIADMNFFGIYELYELASSGTYDKIEKIAAGNGLMSEKNRYENILSK